MTNSTETRPFSRHFCGETRPSAHREAEAKEVQTPSNIAFHRINHAFAIIAMDHLGYYLFSREEPIGAKTQDALASKKQGESTTFAFPPSSSDAFDTASAIAGIHHGHYNADGTRRSNFQMDSSATGRKIQHQLNGGNIAGMSSRAVRADNVLSSTGTSGHAMMRMPSKSTASAPPAQVDELSILRSLMKSSVSSSKITNRLHRGLILEKEQQPTLPLSASNQHGHVSEVIEAPGNAASFPWDISAGIGNHKHHKLAKVLPAKGPATVQKSKLLKLRLGDIAALSSASGVLLGSDASSGIGELFGQINGHSNASVPEAKAPTKKKEGVSLDR